jgi:hypothetical protein
MSTPESPDARALRLRKLVEDPKTRQRLVRALAALLAEQQRDGEASRRRVDR